MILIVGLGRKLIRLVGYESVILIRGICELFSGGIYMIVGKG
jgi:uncharacterized membrane protein YgdD (TMEM256/DUF423 family)